MQKASSLLKFPHRKEFIFIAHVNNSQEVFSYSVMWVAFATVISRQILNLNCKMN